MKTIVKTTIISTGLLLAGPQQLSAFDFSLRDLDIGNKNSGLRRALKEADPTNPNGALGRDLHAKFRICNHSNVREVHYSVNTKQAKLGKGGCTDWTATGQAKVSFDYSTSNGYQGQSYMLNDGRYVFKSVGNAFITLRRVQ